jgi:hypothetical protein
MDISSPILSQSLPILQKEKSSSKTLLRIEIQKTKQERERTKQETKKIILKKLEITKLKLELELKRLTT